MRLIVKLTPFLLVAFCCSFVCHQTFSLILKSKINDLVAIYSETKTRLSGCGQLNFNSEDNITELDQIAQILSDDKLKKMSKEEIKAALEKQSIRIWKCQDPNNRFFVRDDITNENRSIASLLD